MFFINEFNEFQYAKYAFVSFFHSHIPLKSPEPRCIRRCTRPLTDIISNWSTSEMSSYISQSLSLCKEEDKCEWQTHHLFVPIVTPKERMVSFFVAYTCKTGVGGFQPQHLQDGVSYLGRLKRKRKQLKVLAADEDHSVHNYSGARQSSTVETLSFLLWISCSCKRFEPQ